MSTDWPLDGIRVVDLSHAAAGRACAHILAQLGAQVLPAPSVDRLGGEPNPCVPHAPHLVICDSQPDAETPLAYRAGVQDEPAPVVVAVTPRGLDGAAVHGERGDSVCGNLEHPVTAMLTGAHAAVSALGALRWSQTHRRSVLVDVSSTEVVAACLGELLPRALCPRAAHDDDPDVPPGPYVLPCLDGYVAIAAPTAIDRASLAALAGIDPNLLDPGTF